MMPLRVANTSPPPGCIGDLHPQDARHARHTKIGHDGNTFESETPTPIPLNVLCVGGIKAIQMIDRLAILNILYYEDFFHLGYVKKMVSRSK